MPACAAASYLEAEDDGPDESQGEAVVSIDDVVGAHVLQVDPLLLQELQSLVHVLQTVDPHPTLGGFGLKQEKAEFIYNPPKPGTVNCFKPPNKQEEEEESSCTTS